VIPRVEASDSDVNRVGFRCRPLVDGSLRSRRQRARPPRASLSSSTLIDQLVPTPMARPGQAAVASVAPADPPGSGPTHRGPLRVRSASTTPEFSHSVQRAAPRVRLRGGRITARTDDGRAFRRSR